MSQDGFQFPVTTAGVSQERQGAAMQRVCCPHCNQTIEFDPKTIWTSPGTPPKDAIIQCPSCKNWVKVVVHDQKGNGDSDQG